ncbi:unnamed protein product [Cuscuta epithymum]|uniref:HMA domain-containing protein n=3 Tax=Cuscuta epithymum TaxID=186058 RepID=A0AAV0GC18_9ASTE|nr:unnamed protein product [Cuscuta epithymum]CAH9145391.1 unnamed protein product [Cuscuta epithymum]
MAQEPQRMQGSWVTEVQVRMDCNGCVQKVKKALNGIHGISELYIDFPQQRITLVGSADPEMIVKAIKKIRKRAIICSHTELPQEKPSQSQEVPPEGGGGSGSPSNESVNPPAEAPPDEARPPMEPPKDPTPQEINQKTVEEKPCPETTVRMTNKNHRDVEDVQRVVYNHPADYYSYGYGGGEPQWNYHHPRGAGMGLGHQPPPSGPRLRHEPTPLPPTTNSSKLIYEPPLLPNINTLRFMHESQPPPSRSSRKCQEPQPQNPESKHDRGQETCNNPEFKYDPNLIQKGSHYRQEPLPHSSSSLRLKPQEQPAPPNNPEPKYDRRQEPPYNPDFKYDPYMNQNGSRFRQEPVPYLSSSSSSSRLKQQEPTPPPPPPYNAGESKKDPSMLYQNGMDFRQIKEPLSSPYYSSEFRRDPPTQRPVYVSHSYNAYKPPPYVTGYEFARSQPPRQMYNSGPNPYTDNMYPIPRPYTGYDYAHPRNSPPDHYSEDNRNGNNSDGNMSSIFSEENPNACTIS